ncbi:MAG: type II secretion system F family protein [Pseudomonadota bacterium]
MPIFQYRARDGEGLLVTGEIEAVSADELKEGLFHEGMIPIEVKEVRMGALSFKFITNLFGRVTPDELMLFTRQFYTLFKAGVSMDTIFGTMARQSSGRSMQNALVRIRTDLGGGATMAQAFARHPQIFNELYVSMVAAGEEAGILEEVLRNLSSLLQKDFEIQKNIKGAVLYPKIVLAVLVLAVSFLMAFVIPKFVGFYAHYSAELPLPTKLLIGISSFFRNYWYVILLVAGLGFFAFNRFYQTKVGRMKWDRARFHLPVFGALNLKVANARFGHILSALYRSGLTMPRSLEVVSSVIGNVAFAMEVQKVKDEIQRGATLSEALSHQTYFPPVIIETTAVGERSGALGEMLSTVAEHYDLEVGHSIKNLTTLLEPLLLVGIFGMVLLLALAIFLPIWNMSTLVSGKG